MKYRFKATTMVVCALFNAAWGHSATITFDALPGSNTDPFASHSEAGFTVASAEGDWRVAKQFGNPTPDIYCNCAVGTVSVTADSGNPFRFDSVDLAYSSASYEITGLLLGNQILSQQGTTGAGTFFVTVPSQQPLNLIDELRISLSPGTGPGFNIDNINLNPVPSPTSSVLLGIAGLLLTGVGRNRS